MDDCIFCRIARGDAPAWRVHETDDTVAFLDLNPVNAYHTLVIPKRHARDLFDVTGSDFQHVMAAVKHVVDLYRDRLGLANVQVACSSGAQAQQEVFHLHVHIVPRHAGDGQDVTWTPRPELRDQFDALLAALHPRQRPLA